MVQIKKEGTKKKDINLSLLEKIFNQCGAKKRFDQFRQMLLVSIFLLNHELYSFKVKQYGLELSSCLAY